VPNHNMVGVQISPISLSSNSVGYVIAILTGILFWVIQVFGPPYWNDGVNALVILICVIFFVANSHSFMGMAIICGYLAGSLQGIVVTETAMKDGSLLTTTLVSLILSVLLMTANGRFRKSDINFLAYVISIPLVFAAVSYALRDNYFIFNEFKKFVMFVVFLMVALTVDYAKQKEILRLIAHAIFGISLFAIFAFAVFNVGYDYGGLRYAAIPSSALLIPLLYLVYQSKIFFIYTLLILLILVLGFMQPSAKLLVIVSCVLIMEFRELRGRRLFFFMTLALALSFASLELDDMLNHKIASLLSSFAYIAEIVSSGEASNTAIFFHTSVGNMVAEFFTVFGVLVANFSLPLGAGFVVPDLYGWLSFANDAAYLSLSTPDAKYPLHLGFYYLLIWYGPLIIAFANFKKILMFLICFSLFSLSAPSLIFLAAILTMKDTKKLPESTRFKTSLSRERARIEN